MIWLGNNDGFLFIGDERNKLFHSEMNHFVSESIIPEAQKQGLNWFEAIPTHHKWNKTIEQMFSERKLESWQQRVYHLEESNYRKDLEPVLNDQYKLRIIDQQLLLEEVELFENHDFLSGTIREFWAAEEDFLENGFGYCVVDDKRIASICYSSFAVGDMQVIGIETLPDYQRKRLAAKTAHAFVQDCFKRKMTPYWDCMEENIGSWKTAESLGFTMQFDYKGYMFSFEKEI
ncbi:GNAT family N-acetyltransferase [Bacillus sp. JCM 19041]|uniref:GNAT family N-acetyltransferase n=1 Tax=Bacillus sp. JCM 19041 TaxID=1460637 RepID=UPI0006D05D51